MKIMVWQKCEVELSEKVIKECKETYKENNNDFYNFANESEFIEFLEFNYDLNPCDDIIIDKKSFNKLVKKWNEM